MITNGTVRNLGEPDYSPWKGNLQTTRRSGTWENQTIPLGRVICKQPEDGRMYEKIVW
jgi:hypothetical protein